MPPLYVKEAESLITFLKPIPTLNTGTPPFTKVQTFTQICYKSLGVVVDPAGKTVVILFRSDKTLTALGVNKGYVMQTVDLKPTAIDLLYYVVKIWHFL